ncbi:MAG: SDR family NAD(P)-dependent oxidoreductase [Acidimicrobiales bacterium]
MSGRVAFVAGGAGAIGSAICRALAAAGAQVAVADLSTQAADDVARAVGGVGVALDVTDPASVELAVASTAEILGPVEICVNAAGWDLFKPFLETDEAFLDKVLAINLAGPIRVTRTVLGPMVERGWGRIVNVGSDAGRVGSSLESVYSGAKGGVIAFTKTVAREAARAGVTANCVCPGPTDTPLLHGAAAGDPRAEKIVSSLARAVPIGRIGLPGDIAPAVAFLASEEAGFITGQTLSVSGGLTMA